MANDARASFHFFWRCLRAARECRRPGPARALPLGLPRFARLGLRRRRAQRETKPGTGASAGWAVPWARIDSIAEALC
ncbi:hypothetical protein WS68_17455 [Burkholderia sp. TSV86]|nr:hypothetical protein WS68_17455 [Burkholderia sp. TSV86]